MSNNHPKEETFRFELTPLSPDTVRTIRDEAPAAAEQALRDAGLGHLLENGTIKISLDQNFPLTALVVGLIVKVVGDVAVDGIRAHVYPALKKMFKVKEIGAGGAPENPSI